MRGRREHKAKAVPKMQGRWECEAKAVSFAASQRGNTCHCASGTQRGNTCHCAFGARPASSLRNNCRLPNNGSGARSPASRARSSERSRPAAAGRGCTGRPRTCAHGRAHGGAGGCVGGSGGKQASKQARQRVRGGCCPWFCVLVCLSACKFCLFACQVNLFV